MPYAADLPYIDEHAITISAGTDEVWGAPSEALDGAFASPLSSRYAGLVRGTRLRGSGRGRSL